MTTRDDDSAEDAMEKVADTLDEFGGLLNAIPYAEQVLFAVRWARVRRIRTFLRGLNGVVGEIPEEKRRRFETFIGSALGRELLADYADTVLRSRSETASAALAILFADSDEERFDRDFKAAAARALDGIAERTISAFLILVTNATAVPSILDVPYPTHVLRSKVVQSTAPLAQWSQNGQDWVGTVHDLVTRGLLLPDAVGGMRLGDEEDPWCTYFGIGPASGDYSRLLQEARRYLASSG